MVLSLAYAITCTCGRQKKNKTLISLAFCFYSASPIYVDRSFLPDSAMVALVVTSFWMLIAYLQTDRWYYLLLATLFATWGFLTKLPGLIIGIPMLYTILGLTH